MTVSVSASSNRKTVWLKSMRAIMMILGPLDSFSSPHSRGHLKNREPILIRTGFLVIMRLMLAARRVAWEVLVQLAAEASADAINAVRQHHAAHKAMAEPTGIERLVWCGTFTNANSTMKQKVSAAIARLE
jgi:hypothetical protein